MECSRGVDACKRRRDGVWGGEKRNERKTVSSEFGTSWITSAIQKRLFLCNGTILDRDPSILGAFLPTGQSCLL